MFHVKHRRDIEGRRLSRAAMFHVKRGPRRAGHRSASRDAGDNSGKATPTRSVEHIHLAEIDSWHSDCYLQNRCTTEGTSNYLQGMK